MRGYGNPQATFAVECSMDQLAEEAGIDPAEFRLINCNQSGDVTPMRLKITSCGLEECINSVKQKLNWSKKRGKRTGRGVGMGSLIHVAGGARVYKSDGHGMIVKVDQNGHIDVLDGGTDQGQGSPTIISQMVAEALGFRPDDVSLTLGDTGLCLWDAGTHASRHTFMAGNAAVMACEKVKQQILDLAVENIPKIVKSGFRRQKRKDPDFVEPDLDYTVISEPELLDIKDRMVFPRSDPEHPFFRVEVSQILSDALHVGTGES
jgi:xanthine dehydrogenase molybdenum-binding subunit